MIANINGREYHVNYTINGLCMLEKRAEMSLYRLMHECQFTATRLMLWTGLIDNLPDLTVEESGDIIQKHITDGGTLDDIVDIIFEGLSESGLIPLKLEDDPVSSPDVGVPA